MINEHPAREAAYFDRLYETSDDPWGLGERFYELRKRDLLIACLPRERFVRAFEPGCATGLLTRRLAQRCDRVLALDSAARAVTLARARLADARNVTIDQGRIPQDWPPGPFDLVVISEVGYYCADLANLSRSVLDSLSGDGVLVACHWRHPAPDHPHGAEAVHAALAAGLRSVVTHVEHDFLLDVWARDPRSVARRTGIIE